MHRVASLFIFLLVFLLPLSSGGLLAQETESPSPLSQPSQPSQNNPHIALLLPLQSKAFGRAADAFRQGFVTAAEFQPSLPIVSYPTGDQTADIVTAYHQSAQAGAALVVGPLTRGAVTALMKEPLPLPTLALNTPEFHGALPQNLYLFSLNAESEARQVAQMAFAAGHKSALTVTANSPLAKRIQTAFCDEWLGLGGTVAARLNFSPTQGDYQKLRPAIAKSSADMLFLAADAGKARIVRPYLDNTLPTYSTSLVYSDNGEAGRNLDLNQVHFIEMPWFLLRDHPAVMAYPRPANPMSVEMERFYALGIDAYRLTKLLLAKSDAPADWPLDGVTGQIELEKQQFTRELTPAQFRQGEAVATSAAP